MYSPKFTISNEVLRNIGQIEASKEVIENAPLVPFYEKKFQSEALLKTVHHGTIRTVTEMIDNEQVGENVGNDLWHKGIDQENSLPCHYHRNVRWCSPWTSKDHRVRKV